MNTEHILKEYFGFEEKYDFTWVKGDYISARWMFGDKIWVYQKIEGGVWKLSYFLPTKVDDVESLKSICDELIKSIERQRKFERILFSE